MATSWLDLMGDDSNLSLASINSVNSVKSVDPEFDNSQQGVNLLFKNNVKFVSDDSQSRKRTFNQMQSNKTCGNHNDFLPPKAKQRTNDKGEWKKRKTDAKDNDENCHETLNFERFLNVANNERVLTTKLNDNIGNIECKTPKTKTNHQITKIDEEDEDNDEDEEDIDMAATADADPLKRKRATIPTLNNIVFNRGLIFNKVPILSKKKDFCPQQSPPIFLNADQFKEIEQEKEREREEKRERKKKEEKEEKEKEEKEEKEKAEKREREREKKEKEKESESEDCSVWNNPNIEHIIGSNQLSVTWARKLFPLEMKKNAARKEKEECKLVFTKKEEMMHEMSVALLLPPSSSSSGSSLLSLSPSQTTEEVQDVQLPQDAPSRSQSQSHSVAVSVSESSENSNITNTNSYYKPSLDAQEWREKQIKIGKETVGYKNYIQKHPNKDLRFRLGHNLISTPDSKEKIGKKRWCGKYNKWRKFLHKFDFNSFNSQQQQQ